MRLMATCTAGLSTAFPINLLTDLIVEYVTIRSGSDMSFTWGASNQSSATELIARAHAAGARGMVSIWSQWDDSSKNIFGDSSKRAALINNILNLITTTNSDGIYFNWESYSMSNWSNPAWTTFIQELRTAMNNAGMSGKVIQATSPSTKITVEAACVNNYYDTLYVNCYDVDPYPQEWYGSFEGFKKSLSDYTALGISKDKICGALNIAWRGASSGEDNWITWAEVLAGYKGSPVPVDNQNAVPSSTEWGYLYGCGYDLVATKAQYVKDNNFAGMKMYMANIDSTGPKSQAQNIYNVLNIGGEDPSGGSMVVIIGGKVSNQASANETVTIKITKPDGTILNVLANTNSSGDYLTEIDLTSGTYKFQASIPADSVYTSAVSPEVSYTVTVEPVLLPRTITLNVG